MATAITADQTTALYQVLQCNQCKNELHKPHTLLQCLHSFCKTCLDGIPKTTKEDETGWFCPTCSTFSKEKELRKNSFIEDLMVISKDKDPQEKERKTCSQCAKKDKIVTGKCNDCKIELCDECHFIHLQIPMLKDHKISTVDEEADKVIDRLIFCPVHKTKPIEFNCKTCEKLVCLSCNLDEHNIHETETIAKAVDRLQPELESNSEKIKSNIETMELQIKMMVIEKTKESYASCRLDLDERLETVINRLKATKATMEDEITELETFVLDILGNIKLYLDNQLSLAKNLANLVDVTTDKARHTSLLCEMQNSLYKRVEKYQNLKDSLDFKNKIPEFLDEQSFDEKVDDLQRLIGELRYAEPVCSIDSLGVKWVDDEFLCSDLDDVFKRKLTKEMEIDLGKAWSNRLSYIDNKVLLCCFATGEIKIFNKYGRHLDTKSKEGVLVVKKANNGNIIVGGYYGLFVTNQDFSDWIKLMAGQFCDIVIYGKKFSALEFQTPKVSTFVLKREFTTGKISWSEEFSFQIRKIANLTDTLSINSNYHYLIWSNEHICEYSDTGDHLQTMPIKCKDRLSICGIDGNCKVLLCSFNTGELYAREDVKELHIFNLPSLCVNKKIKGNLLRDVVIDSDNNIWYLEGSIKSTFRLVKYTAEK